jgi:predicted transcriptional regulator
VVSAKAKTVRLPDTLVARVEAVARANKSDFSTVMRFALQRGLAAMEAELVAPVDPPRRRVLSRGVDS